MGIKRYSHIIENTEIYNFMLQVFADEYFQELVYEFILSFLFQNKLRGYLSMNIF
jgi:hypothetical protein